MGKLETSSFQWTSSRNHRNDTDALFGSFELIQYDTLDGNILTYDLFNGYRTHINSYFSYRCWSTFLATTECQAYFKKYL